jgi:hypothetical protein
MADHRSLTVSAAPVVDICASTSAYSRHFGPIRGMFAYPLTAAREQKFRDRGFEPHADQPE